MKVIGGLTLLFSTLAFHGIEAQQNGFGVRVGGLGFISKRSAAFNGDSVATESGMMKGLAGFARYRFVGLSARVWGGSFGAQSSATAASGKIANADLSLLVGVPAGSVEVGYARRGFTGALGTITWSYITLGGRAEVPIGSTGVHAGASVAGYARVEEVGGSGTGRGAEGETSLAYIPARLPVYLWFGYSIQRFTVRNAAGEKAPEQISGIFISLGFRFGQQ
jgi:hypothetical protein